MVSIFRDHGVVLKDSQPNLNETAEDRNIYQFIEPGWLIVNRMKAWQGSVGVSDIRGICSGHYLCFRPRHNEDSRFLNWLVRSSDYAQGLAAYSRGVRPGQAEIDNNYLRLLPMALPTRAEQVAIANFLDRETAKIDSLIEKQRLLVERVRVRTASVISQVVRSDAVAGEGPRLKYFITGMRQGWSPQCNNWPAEAGEWAVLKVGCVNGGRFRASENKQLPEEIAPRPETAVQDGELLVSRANTRELVGSAAVAHGAHPRLMLGDKVYAIRLNERANADFVSFALRTRRFRDLIELEATGASSSMQNISQGIVMNLPMNLPSREVQDASVARLEQVLEASDELIAKAERHIEVAHERRSALVTAAVTGQIDVRRAA